MMATKTIQLFKPHNAQKQIIEALEDKVVFFVTVVAGRQIGKSLLGMNIAIHWAINDPKCTIYWVSPTDSQAHKVYKQIINAIVETGIIKSKKGGKGDTEIILINGSRLLFRSAASEDSLRGESVNYMILDEGAFIKSDTINTILLPMLNVKGKKCLVITTPKSKNWVFDWYNKGLTEKRWRSFRFSTYDSPYANEGLIQMFKDTLPDKLFQQEIMADFIDNASVFNNINDIMNLDHLEAPIVGKNYWAGIDIGLITDATVLSIIDEEGNLVKYYRWQKVESPDLINEIIRINSLWNFKKIQIENNNQGLTIYQDLKRKINNIVDINTNQKTKPEMINRLIHLFNMKEMRLIKDEYLRIELEGFIFKQNNGIIKFQADSGFHDDCVMSLAIARNCFEHFKYDKKYVGFF
jgi:hypothetical protein